LVINPKTAPFSSVAHLFAVINPKPKTAPSVGNPLAVVNPKNREPRLRLAIREPRLFFWFDNRKRIANQKKTNLFFS
jgi:hypothetical protein